MHREVGRGIHEHLERERRASPVPGALRAHRGHIPASAVTGDDKRLARVLRGDPDQRVPRVLERRGERVLGGKPVVDRDESTSGALGEHPAHRVVGVEIADRPAAAVDVEDRGRCLGRFVEPRGDRCAGDRDREVLDDRDLGAGADDVDDEPRLFAGGRGGELWQSREARCLQCVDQLPGLGVKRHWNS